MLFFFDFYFYFEVKYVYMEFEIFVEFIRKVIDRKLLRYVEVFVEGFLVKSFGLRFVRIEMFDLEFDIVF